MKKLLILIILSISFIPSYSKAADTYTLLEPLPCISGVGNCKEGEIQKEIDINGYILYVYKFSIGLAVVLAIVMIIWGGFEYMTSEVPFIKSDGKTKIQNAVTGLAMVLVSYLILVTIDPRLVNIYSNIEPIKISSKDLAEIAQYNDQKTIDFQAINAENQIEFDRMNREIDNLKKAKAGIDADLKNGVITTAEAELQRNIMDNEIRDIQSSRSVVLAENTGLSSYAQAVKVIHNFEARGESYEQYIAEPIKDITAGKTLRPVNGNNVIQNQYNEKINAIIKSNTNFESVAVLEKQRDFFIQQVKIEAAIEVDSARNNKSDLNKKLSEAQLDLNDANKQSASGLSPDNYQKIMQARIVTIKDILSKK